MFTSVSIYFLLTALIFWAYCGYLISLYLLSLFSRNKEGPNLVPSYPDVSILVPCLNEETLVDAKIRDIMALDYPKDKLRVLFLDGGSDDMTCDKIRQFAPDNGTISLVKTNKRGKVNQINHVLPDVDTEIIVCSDMDAEMKSDVLKRIAGVFESDPRVRVAGAMVMPKGGSSLEAQYWEDQNVIRLLESEVHSSSIVIAPCYAFKKGLIREFPEDCVADDIYISFIANAKGFLVKYLKDAVVYETRTPSSLSSLITHKFRKGNAFIIEILRFLYLLPRMHPRWKLIFLTKLLQVIIMPWVLVFYAISSASLVLSGLLYVKIVALSATALLLSLFTTSFLMAKKRKSLINRVRKRVIAGVFIVTNLILLLNGLTFPFYHQSSEFPKVNG